MMQHCRLISSFESVQTWLFVYCGWTATSQWVRFVAASQAMLVSVRPNHLRIRYRYSIQIDVGKQKEGEKKHFIQRGSRMEVWPLSNVTITIEVKLGQRTRAGV